MEFIQGLLNSSLFGTIIGFALGKLGTKWDEEQKVKKEGFQLLKNLLHEIGENRFKAEAILQGNGNDPIYFGTMSWDVLKLNKYFNILANDKALLDSIYYLYFYTYQANLRVSGVHASIDNVIRNQNQQTSSMNSVAYNVLKEYLQRIYLPKLKEVEMALRIFLEKERIL